MRVYDIAREVFSARVFPGDPAPQAVALAQMAQGSPYNLTRVTLGSHTGTHMDAPSHFVAGGKTIDQLDLHKCVGPCLVAEAAGPLSPRWVEEALAGGATRLLIKGDIEITPQSAEKMVELGLGFLGVEHLTVGTEETGVQVHRILLGAEVALLEACTLAEVPAGEYLLVSPPLKYGGLDGAQARPLLLGDWKEA